MQFIRNKLLDTTVYIVLAEHKSICQCIYEDDCKPFTACTRMDYIFRNNYNKTFKLQDRQCCGSFATRD